MGGGGERDSKENPDTLFDLSSCCFAPSPNVFAFFSSHDVLLLPPPLVFFFFFLSCLVWLRVVLQKLFRANRQEFDARARACVKESLGL